MGFKNRKWKILFILLFLASRTPTSKLAAYFHVAPCDFVFLLLLHQCSLLRHGQDKPCTISAYVLLETRKRVSVAVPREMVSSH